MSEVISVTFQGGAFVPDQPVHVATGTRAKVVLDEATTPVSSVASSSNIDRSRVIPAEDAIAQLEELCQRVPIHSGLRLTRDELHERD